MSSKTWKKIENISIFSMYYQSVIPILLCSAAIIENIQEVLHRYTGSICFKYTSKCWYFSHFFAKSHISITAYIRANIRLRYQKRKWKSSAVN